MKRALLYARNPGQKVTFNSKDYGTIVISTEDAMTEPKVTEYDRRVAEDYYVHSFHTKGCPGEPGEQCGCIRRLAKCLAQVRLDQQAENERLRGERDVVLLSNQFYAASNRRLRDAFGVIKLRADHDLIESDVELARAHACPGVAEPPSEAISRLADAFRQRRLDGEAAVIARMALDVRDSPPPPPEETP